MTHRHETVSEQPKLLCEKASRFFTIQYRTEDGDGRKECSNHSQCEEPTAKKQKQKIIRSVFYIKTEYTLKKEKEKKKKASSPSILKRMTGLPLSTDDQNYVCWRNSLMSVQSISQILNSVTQF